MSRSRRSPGRRLAGAGVTAFTWMIVLLAFLPVLWMVFTSFKSESDAATNPPSLFVPLSFDRYVEAFDRGIAGNLLNSVTVSVLSTVIVILLAIPVGYALAFRPGPRATDILFYFISTRFLPVAVAAIPIYLLLLSIGGLDKVGWLIVLYLGMNLPLAIWMMRSFFAEVPAEIIEAAQVDGANVRTELTRIAVPIVAPGIAAAALICFIFAWNEYFLANLLTATVGRTTPPILGSFVDGRGQFVAVLSAASTIAILPVVIAGWFAQKQLVRGLAMGAIK
ncbi:carbohydrate ABC transporter permease [Pseudonocardia sp. MH-G8]|uniref:carbohydrate ABC transporter permease n=1 Tax=Pseudonocardia sp. MH-G8 TaxID=1854588 RepID=UPI000BA1333A|nr:carbohydrate ABC transporter permease [Pseudonocardia sp. MH-G8]OZM77988.1 sugar ABC transporter permease [Pseudonocardia sp. MH-G8]